MAQCKVPVVAQCKASVVAQCKARVVAHCNVPVVAHCKVPVGHCKVTVAHCKVLGRYLAPACISVHYYYQHNINNETIIVSFCFVMQVEGLYLMMGRGLDRLQQVPAGNVIAIGGLGTAILKSATITSTPACRPLAPMLFQVRVTCIPFPSLDIHAVSPMKRLSFRVRFRSLCLSVWWHMLNQQCFLRS